MKSLDYYTRVSTQEQKLKGNPLNVQRDIGKRVAKKLGLAFRHRDEGARSSTIHYRDILEQLKEDITIVYVDGKKKSLGYKIEEGSKIFKTGKVEDLTVKLGRSVKKKTFGKSDKVSV